MCFSNQLFSKVLSVTAQIVVFACILAFSSQAMATTRIVILGDSLSASYGMQQNEGWVHLLQQEYNTTGRDIKLINASISGETTAGGLMRLPGLLKQHKTDVLIVELGGNDGLRGFPIKQMKNNLLQIIQQAQALEIQVLLMQIEIPPNFGRRYTNMFQNAYPQLAQQTNIKLLPFFMRDIATKPHLMQDDRIHPNKAAQPQIKDFVRQHLDNSVSF